MATGVLITTLGKKIAVHRIFTASPTYTAPSCFKVGTGTTTPAIADSDLTTAITIGGSATKAIVSGYPVLDETNMNATTRALILTTECNTNTITEFGFFNTDATKKMFSHAVFTAISKTSSVQIIFIEKDKVI